MNGEGRSSDLLQSGHTTSLPDRWQENGLLDALPTAAYICDGYGFVTKYNEEAARLWGRHPAAGLEHERFSASLVFHQTNGAPLSPDQRPEAACLKDGLPKKIWRSLWKDPIKPASG